MASTITLVRQILHFIFAVQKALTRIHMFRTIYDKGSSFCNPFVRAFIITRFYNIVTSSVMCKPEAIALHTIWK